MRNLEIIGEAAKRISPELRAQLAELPWRQIADLRDVSIRDYPKSGFGACLIGGQRDVPELLGVIRRASLAGGSWRTRADLEVCPTRVMEYKRTGYNACGGSYDGGPSRRNRAGAGLGSVTGGGPQQRKQQAAGSPRRERIGGNHRNGVYEARSGEGIARFGPGRALYRGRGGSGAAFWQGGRHQPRRFRSEDRQKWREERAVRAQPDRGARRHGDPADWRRGRHRHAR